MVSETNETTQYTPGPWAPWLNKDTNQFEIMQDDGRGYGRMLALVVGVRGAFKANARLMATAPELLDALRGLVAAVARARAAEDGWQRSGHLEALGPDLEDAHATLIIRENAALSVIAKALGQS
jgi:hypothetical protein